MMARICEELPHGLADITELEALTDRLLERDDVADMPRTGPAHMANNDRYTTQDVLDAEHAIVAATTTGLHAGLATVAPAVAALALEVFETSAGYPLDPEQRDAYTRLVTAGHAIDTIIGVPGSGKTTTMATARIAWEAAGLTVAGSSTAALAAHHLGTEAGLDQSRSVAYWLTLIEHGDGLHGIDVLILDEAAMTDTRDLAALLHHATQTGTKIVEIGDPHQLASPGVGGAFTIQHDLTGGPNLTINRRQTNHLERQALEHFRNREHEQALALWADSGRLVVTVTPQEAKLATLNDWWTNWHDHTDPYHRLTRTLMLAHHNNDVDDLNLIARALARQAGHLTGPDTAFPTHHGHDIPLAAGDVVLLRTNAYRHGDGPDLLNGTRGIITHVDPHARHITLTWHDAQNQPHTGNIDADYIAAGGLEHGYATTVHKAQGQTADHVSLYSLDANRATLYTGMSRDRITARTFQPATTLTTDITLEQWQAMTPEHRRTKVIELMRNKLKHQQPATMASHELDRINTYTQTPPPTPPEQPARQHRQTRHRTKRNSTARRITRTHPWISHLGPRPTTNHDEQAWTGLVASIAAYRHDHDVQTADPLGPQPTSPAQRTDWYELNEFTTRYTRSQTEKQTATALNNLHTTLRSLIVSRSCPADTSEGLNGADHYMENSSGPAPSPGQTL
ncbi:hypothetical protein BJF79_07415 [Actinomadura sp. CNU-125]|uniref:ATP-dependent DNA helicase n=1 Tax=Actinomadura sp. CNU-125 TaxID=1904961 RepID=UPI0009640281|nr:AAA family ATPase [Actinomadura sp. CNU-125]OLT34387.1 hypothetical protein BJF79_07415 [Actinomadura sp. CNU-125]